MPHVGITTARMRTSVGAWGIRLLRAARRARTGEKAPKSMIIAKAWYLLYNMGAVCMVPYLVLLYSGRGFSTLQVGLLCAVRPWVSAPAGNLVVAAADARGAHRTALIGTFLVALGARVALTHASGFAANLVLSAIGESAAAPMGVLVEAAVVAVAMNDGEYGRTRMWASIGWGGMSPFAGALIERHGLRASLHVYAVAVLLAFVPTCLLPLAELGPQKAETGSQGLDLDKGSQAASVQLPRQQQAEVLATPTPVQLEWAAMASATPVSPILAWQVQAQAAAAAAAATGAEAQGVVGEQAEQAGGIEDQGHPAVGTSVSFPATVETTRATQGPRPYTVLHLTADGTLASQPSTPKGAPAGSVPVVPLAMLPRDSAAGALLTPPRTRFVGAGSEAGSDSSGDCCSYGSESSSVVGGEAGGVWGAVAGLLRQPPVAIFFWMTLLMGVGNGIIGYLFLFLDDLGARGTLLGLCLSANCAAEIPMFFFSGKILKRLGVLPAFHLSMAAFILRTACYALLPFAPTPWLVLAVETLQGATFALGWTAGCVYIKRTAPRHARSTTQSIFAGLYSGIGAGLGALLAGGLYGPLGGARVFAAGSAVLAVGWAVALAALWFLQRRGAARSYTRLETELAGNCSSASP